jgi:hypothetical protein
MAKSKEEQRYAAKRRRLAQLYRITPEEDAAIEVYERERLLYRILLEKGDPKEEAKLFLDHRHSDGLIRGKLAYLINKGLGTIEGTYKERTPQILRALADYLEHPPATAVLGGPRYGLLGKAKVKKKMVYGPPVQKESK